VKDIYSFAESETTSHKLPDKEEAQLYYANRPLSVKTETETEIKSTKLDSSSKFNNNNNEGEMEATANYSSDDEIEILDDEQSTPKKDPLPKKTSNNNSSTKRKEISPKTNSKNVSKNNSPKTNSKNVSQNNSSDSGSLLGQFDNLMERVLQSQIGNGQSPTGSGQKDRRETGSGQKENGQTGSGQKKNLKRLSFESNKGGNEKQKKSKLSPINKKATKAMEDDSDIEEITLTDDDDDLNEESLSNLGNNTDLEIDDVKDQIVIEYDSPLLDTKVERDETLKNNNPKSKAKQLHFSDSQLDEEYDPIEINSNVVSRKSNNKTSPKNIRVIEQKDSSSSSDDDAIIIEDDDHDDDFTKPTLKVKKIEKPSSLKNVLITPRTTKDEAKFAQSKITSTPIGGIERSISKTKIPAKSKLTSESSEDDIEVRTNNSNDQVIFFFLFAIN
jgi:hypothetical protein